MQYYMFLDESGDSGTTKDTRFNAFVLCGVLFSHDNYMAFNDVFTELKVSIFGDPNIIFHSYDMRKHIGPFKVLRDKDLLSKFYKGIGSILTEQNYTLIACVIDKEKYSIKYPDKNQVYEDSLKFICERAIAFVGRKSKGNTIRYCLEKRTGGKDRYLKKYYTEFVRYGTDYCSTESFQMCYPELYFRGKKQGINGLQLADLCAYPIAYKTLYPDRAQLTYDLIEPKFYRSFFGKINGWGLKRFP